ncbi:20174_t:CDS:2, partial [Rhizophagus irregularis]
FKVRNGLQKVNFSGEANSAPLETLPEERLRLRTLLAKYNEEDIYNADETGLFFWMEPNHTLGSGSHKFPPLVIGKANNPRCFKNINRTSLPVTYRANSKAWMRSDIFVEWLHHLDNWFRVMDRKILLLIDNAGSHFNPKTFDEDSSDLSEDNEENVAESSHSAQSRTKSKKKVTKKKPNIKLTNIKLIYLPPNTTAHLQPMDAGIIHSFKSKYKQEFCKHLIQQFDNGIDQKRNKLNIKEAINYIAEAWEDVTPTTIQNCWKKTGILPASDFLVDDSNMQDFEIDESDELDGINIDCLPEVDELREYL